MLFWQVLKLFHCLLCFSDKNVHRMLLTFSLVVFGMFIFRCTTVHQFVGEMETLSHGLFSVPQLGELKCWIFVGVMIFVEWLNRTKDHGLDLQSVYIVLLLLIFLNGGQTTGFIYQVF